MENTQDYVTCDFSIEDASVDPDKLNQWLFDLKKEINDTGLVTILSSNNAIMPSGTKGADPVFAALTFSMLSTSLPLILTFAHDWALRRESRVLKIKIQSQKDEIIEVEIPGGMSKDEVKDWIKLVQKSVKNKK
jgi:hypothetical protein